MPTFSNLPIAVPDPIFAVAAKARAAGPEAIDGTVGVYLSEEGKPALFPSVQRALQDVGATLAVRSYSYPPLTGLPAYRAAVTRLLFGEDAPLVAGIASTGGTGAVALNLRLALLFDSAITLILPTPAWANYPRLIGGAQMRRVDVPYLDGGRPTIEGITQALRQAKGSCVVLLQAGCHNPVGLDFDQGQWEELTQAMKERQAITLLDLAYQGFAGTPEEDAKPVRLFARQGVTTLVAWSASKNHALYGERTGFACAVVPDEAFRKQVEGHYALLTRSIHSAAATFGQTVVTRVQEAYSDAWRQDLAAVRSMLHRKRQALSAALPERMRGAVSGQGMFALLPLSPAEIDRLQTEQKVFLTDDGRINVAGIPLARMEELGEKIRKVAG